MEGRSMIAEKADFFKSLLMDRLYELQLSVKKASIAMKTDETRLSDPFDMAVTEFQKSMELKMSDRERLLIREIRDALARIDKGAFGVCLSCGEHISKKRLLANPTSRLCRDCKANEENRSKESLPNAEIEFAETAARDDGWNKNLPLLGDFEHIKAGMLAKGSARKAHAAQMMTLPPLVRKTGKRMQ